MEGAESQLEVRSEEAGALSQLEVFPAHTSVAEPMLKVAVATRAMVVVAIRRAMGLRMMGPLGWEMTSTSCISDLSMAREGTLRPRNGKAEYSRTWQISDISASTEVVIPSGQKSSGRNSPSSRQKFTSSGGSKHDRKARVAHIRLAARSQGRKARKLLVGGSGFCGKTPPTPKRRLGNPATALCAKGSGHPSRQRAAGV